MAVATGHNHGWSSFSAGLVWPQKRSPSPAVARTAADVCAVLRGTKALEGFPDRLSS